MIKSQFLFKFKTFLVGGGEKPKPPQGLGFRTFQVGCILQKWFPLHINVPVSMHFLNLNHGHLSYRNAQHKYEQGLDVGI